MVVNKLKSWAGIASIAILVMGLVGCAGYGARVITTASEASAAAKDLVVEVMDWREELRGNMRDAHRSVIRCYQVSLSLGAQGVDCGPIEKRADALATYIEGNYPNLAALANELRSIRAAFKGEAPPAVVN